MHRHKSDYWVEASRSMWQENEGMRAWRKKSIPGLCKGIRVWETPSVRNGFMWGEPKCQKEQRGSCGWKGGMAQAQEGCDCPSKESGFYSAGSNGGPLTVRRG